MCSSNGAESKRLRIYIRTFGSHTCKLKVVAMQNIILFYHVTVLRQHPLSHFRAHSSLRWF